MFSISTIASSTRMPATRLSASRLMPFSVKPSESMKKNAGMHDSGIAIAEISVARQSRRKKKTTTTARKAPSNSERIDERYCSRVCLTLSSVSSMWTCGFSSLIFFSSAVTLSIVWTSDPPLALRTSNEATSRPLYLTIRRCSALPSRTEAMSPSRTTRLAEMGMRVSASDAAVRAPPSTRTDCSAPAICVRPPVASMLSARMAPLICAAVTP